MLGCCSGWFSIIDAMCSLIQDHIDIHSEYQKNLNRLVPSRHSFQFKAQQVKEKFGCLKFYYEGGDERIAGVVKMAEKISLVTCQFCGNPGTMTKEKTRFMTLCNACRSGPYEELENDWNVTPHDEIIQ